MQLQLLLHPQLSPPPKMLLPFPQQENSKIKIIIQEQLFPPSHALHPQFVAAKSLISDLQIIYFTLYVMPAITNGYRKMY